MMHRAFFRSGLVILGLLTAGEVHVCAQSTERTVAIERAIGYLGREVQSWPEEKGCFSCHNNGDGARALYIAMQQRRGVDVRFLKENTQWLAAPQRWNAGGEGAPFKDPKLATVQFAAALTEATRAGKIDREPLRAAAAALVEHQAEDGSWRIDGSGLGGSPITYGDALATAFSRRTLVHADPDRFAPQITGADRWLRASRSQRTVDAAAILWALADADDAAASDQRSRSLELLLRAQGASGGWGLFAGHAAEPFDTAVAIMALATVEANQDAKAAIDRACEYLIETQSPDGSWPETTRPAGGHSYAHGVSTTAWALIGLLLASSE